MLPRNSQMNPPSPPSKKRGRKLIQNQSTCSTKHQHAPSQWMMHSQLQQHRSPALLVRTPQQGTADSRQLTVFHSMPLRACEICGGTWFRVWHSHVLPKPKCHDTTCSHATQDPTQTIDILLTVHICNTIEPTVAAQQRQPAVHAWCSTSKRLLFAHLCWLQQQQPTHRAGGRL